jgi:hypothetical protein
MEKKLPVSIGQAEMKGNSSVALPTWRCDPHAMPSWGCRGCHGVQTHQGDRGDDSGTKMRPKGLKFKEGIRNLWRGETAFDHGGSLPFMAPPALPTSLTKLELSPPITFSGADLISAQDRRDSGELEAMRGGVATHGCHAVRDSMLAHTSKTATSDQTTWYWKQSGARWQLRNQ